MKRFISTKLFLLLQEASQEGIDVDAQVLQNSYDEFALLLFAEDAASTGRAAFRNTSLIPEWNSKVYRRYRGKNAAVFLSKAIQLIDEPSTGRIPPLPSTPSSIR